ncbi:YihY family inner membrane protein [Chitinivorax sp. PXF-14]|uniref:YihY family inner membrane protein n=1 Tax=Chitinivorax sp. PXF-14 TaxID=3230488 RepID=UPI00346767B9
MRYYIGQRPIPPPISPDTMLLTLIDRAKRTPLHAPAGFLRYVFTRFQQDQCLQTAGSLTFTTLLALVPFLTIVLMIFSAFPVFESFSNQFKVFLLTNLVPTSSGKIITVYMRQFSDNAAKLTAVGIITLGVTSLMMILTIERAFNAIWRVTTPRPMFRRIIMYWAALTLGPIIIGASLSLTSWLLTQSMDYAKEVPFGEAALASSVQLLLGMATFSLLYYAVPNCEVPVKHALTAGAVAAVVFEFVKRGFAVYIKGMGSYKLVYGAFSSFPIFLLWLYVMWATILFGAVLSASLSYWETQAWRRKPLVGRSFFDAIRVLVQLYHAQQRGEAPSARQLQKKLHCGLDQLSQLLARLHKAQLIDRNDGNGWLLRRSAERITLAELYHLLVMVQLRPDRMHPQEQALAAFLAGPLGQIEGALAMDLKDLAERAGLDG